MKQRAGTERQWGKAIVPGKIGQDTIQSPIRHAATVVRQGCIGIKSQAANGSYMIAWFPTPANIMRAKKVDTNQKEIVAALRKCGATVQDLSKVGEGCPDLLVGHHGVNYLLEVKDSGGKLNPRQVEWHGKWNGQRRVVWSVRDALWIVCHVDY